VNQYQRPQTPTVTAPPDEPAGPTMQFRTLADLLWPSSVRTWRKRSSIGWGWPPWPTQAAKAGAGSIADWNVG
jgi:hypothetical protein